MQLGDFRASEVITTFGDGAAYGLPPTNASKYSVVTKGGYWHPDMASPQVIAYEFKRVKCRQPINPESDETSVCDEYKIGYCIECPRKRGKKFINRSVAKKGQSGFGTEKGKIFQSRRQHEAWTGKPGRDTKNDAKRHLAVRKAAEKCIKEAFAGSSIRDDYTCSAKSQQLYEYAM